MSRTWLLMIVACSISACGGSQPDGGTTPAPGAAVREAPAPAPTALPTAAVTRGQIARADLGPILAAGFPRFLQHVDTEPHLDHGRFVGFRLRALFRDDPRFAAIDLGPGDTVVRVNGQPIERPEQALAVWNGLGVASELVVDYLRTGEPRQLRFTIVD